MCYQIWIEYIDEVPLLIIRSKVLSNNKWHENQCQVNFSFIIQKTSSSSMSNSMTNGYTNGYSSTTTSNNYSSFTKR